MSALPESPSTRSPPPQLVQRPAICDWPTAAVIAVMTLGFPAAGLLYQRGLLPAWAVIVIGTWLMNLSFTAWHEPAHGNFSRHRRANDAAGVISSFASMYPGYFARRREHLVHHRYEGDPLRDPVHPRIQTTFLGFPFRLLMATVRPPRQEVPASFVEYTARHRWLDRSSNAGALALVGLSIPAGFWQAALLVWVVPRLIVFGLHAYYICFFPHAVPGGGYQLLRVRRWGPLFDLLTMNQMLHGVHHLWPSIPWHAYGEALSEAGPIEGAPSK